MKVARALFTVSMTLIAAAGFAGASIYLFSWALSEPQMLFPAIAFTVIVGGMLSLVFSIIAHASLGMGLRQLVRYLVFGAQYWALGKTAKEDN